MAAVARWMAGDGGGGRGVWGEGPWRGGREANSMGGR